MTRILIADDHPENLYLLRAILQGNGYEVDEARHGAEALTRARQTLPDLVISDLLMPVMDGYALLRQWKSDEVLKTIPFMVYTATYTDPKDERLALDLGADAFLVKPAEPEAFIARVSEVLARQARGGESPRASQVENDVLLREYNEALVRKLEKKAAQLEQANRELTEEIAERRRTEAALRDSEQQFRQAQKMEAVGQLAGGVAHDFNNLLTVIISYSDLVLERLGPGDPMRDLLAEITRAGERAAALTRQLLAISRQQVLEPKLLDLNTVVGNTEKMLARLIGEDILLVTHLNPDIGLVKADPGQIEQVLLNLVVNARDAMPEGGSLTIETTRVRLDKSYCQTVADLKPGDYVLLAVSDTGCGIDKETLGKIFEPFFTTKGVGKGTGLGLATVQGIVKQSNGHVAVYSEVGQGAAFKVYLPLATETSASLPPEISSQAMPRGNEVVLLAEDDDAVRTLAKHVLQGCGYRVFEATNGKDALELAERESDPIHLLISDVVMPHLGGRALAEQFIAMRPDSRVLFMSGYADDAVIRHGVLEAEFAFLQKPFTPSSLAQKVRAVLDVPKRSEN